MIRPRRFVLLAALSLVGCVADSETGADGTRPEDDRREARATGEAFPTEEAPPMEEAGPTEEAGAGSSDPAAVGGPGSTDEADAGSWTVTFDGAGPLDLGMTRSQAAAALDVDSLEVEGPGSGCGYVMAPQTPEGIAAMIVDDRMVRIDVMEGSTATDQGARIGDPEDRIRELYGDRVEEQPHKYVDGSYLLVSPPRGSSDRRIVFETEGATVTRFRTGLLPQVRWVEGCS